MFAHLTSVLTLQLIIWPHFVQSHPTSVTTVTAHFLTVPGSAFRFISFLKRPNVPGR